MMLLDSAIELIDAVGQFAEEHLVHGKQGQSSKKKRRLPGMY